VCERERERERMSARQREQTCNREYGVATISRLLKTIDLFCKRAL